MDHIYGIGDRIKAQRVKRKMSQKQARRSARSYSVHNIQL